MNPILRLEKVSKSFGGVVAAKDVTFSVMSGTIHGLIGPNGAGKSTLMDLISGISEVDSGKVFLNEEEVTKIPPHKRARMGIGRTFQTPRFLQRSNIRDNLLLGTDLADQMGYFFSYFGKKGSDFETEMNMYMEHLNFSLDLESDIGTLTFGQRKQLEVVRALLTHPKVLLVDEPAAGLNNAEIDDIMSLLNYAASELEIGVLLIEHSMDMVMNICEQIVVINFGQVIAEGNPEEISRNEAVIEAYLGREMNA
jgi:ABC-type branched-subunit amino acid transport system ATPase component